MNSAVAIGVLAAVIPYFAVAYLKKILGYDDALDTFGIHGVGGTLGALLTGVFADPTVNPILKDMKLMDGLLMAQIKAIFLTIGWSVAATVVLAFVVKAIVGLRPDQDVERAGLDTEEHGEVGYEL
jgi:Amt family ammonium transporter